MTTETMNNEQSETNKTKGITFKCKFCGETKPFDEMRTLTRFFPPIVACRDCEKKME